MKSKSVLSAVLILGLAGCETMNRPITSGDFDPLRTPGSHSNVNLASDAIFSPGQIVKASMNNTAFFKNRPKGDGDADKLIVRGTSMKVISTSDSYVKVELDGTGEVGWVPAVQLEDPASGGAAAVNSGEYQIYPPIGNGMEPPLPSSNPLDTRPNESIPTVIDPDAPVKEKAIESPVTPPADPSLPVVQPKKESTPLPPNGEEEKATPAAEAFPQPGS